MKHAKQQFDKLKKQSHDRNIENETLRSEIQNLRTLSQPTTPPGLSESVSEEDRLHFQTQIDEVQTQRSVRFGSKFLL